MRDPDIDAIIERWQEAERIWEAVHPPGALEPSDNVFGLAHLSAAHDIMVLCRRVRDLEADADRVTFLETHRLGVWHRASTNRWESYGGRTFTSCREAIDGARNRWNDQH